MKGTLKLAAVVVAVIAIAVVGVFTMPQHSELSATTNHSGVNNATASQNTSTVVSSSYTTTSIVQSKSQDRGNVTIWQYSFSKVALEANAITANPVNLSQLSEVSKFRSCAGHDFSGYDYNGSLETARSMKHYFTIKSSYTGLSHVVQIFSPFNGTLVWDNKTLDYPNGDQIVIKSEAYPSIGTEIFHIDLLPGLAAGSQLRAGQLIGYKNASETSGFDIALGPINPMWPCGGRCGTPMADVWDSIFNHMDPEVLAQFMAVGINQSNIVVTKSYRDSHPCFYPNETSYGSSGVNTVEYSDPNNWVNVT